MSTEKLFVLPDLSELQEEQNVVQGEKGSSRRSASRKKEVNPAMAFTYSILFWGGGQLHNNQDWMGFALAFLMFLFYGCLAAAAFWWDVCLEYIGLFPANISYIYVGAVGFVTLGLTIWLSSSVQAYLRASQTRSSRFDGVQNRTFPCVCSLIVPGWGQFLNGQMKKGALFILASLAGYVSVSVLLLTLVFWPLLNTPSERVAVEWLLLPAVLVMPVFLFASLVSAYDAFRVSVDEIKKEPLRKRLEYANNRRRMQGWRRGVWPQVRLTLALTLTLCLCLGVAYHAIPTHLYLISLTSLRDLLLDHHLSVIPGLINRAVLMMSA